MVQLCNLLHADGGALVGHVGAIELPAGILTRNFRPHYAEEHQPPLQHDAEGGASLLTKPAPTQFRERVI